LFKRSKPFTIIALLMKRPLIFILFLTFIGTLAGFARYDDDIIGMVTAQLTKWATTNPQEKVYLHLDKPYYAAGDDIWFKAYVTKGGEHKLSDLSGILNVELIGGQDSVSKAIKLPIIAGMAWGDFKLADSLAEGCYRIRAYTAYMQNAGEDYYFDKEIAIGNAISNTVTAKAGYTFNPIQNNQQKVDAVLTYIDLDGQPEAGKEVTYVVQLSARQTAHGKGITDAKGKLYISYINTAPMQFKSGSIITTVKLSPTQKVIKIIPVTLNTNTDVQFFPEGGTLINGIRTRVAFKAIAANGLGTEVTGVLIDEQNNEVAAITTDHLGMGSFAFTPQAGRSYTAKLNTGIIPLPKTTDEGYVLNVYNNNPDMVTVRVSISEATLKKEQNGEINLVVQSGGNIIFAAKTKMDAASFSTKIPKSRFPSGIAQFTLFSGKGEPLNERIAFIQNDDQLKLNISTTKPTYAPREKVNISLNAKNKDNQPIAGAFSVAVIDENKVQANEDEESTILSHLLLSSDIKGYIEKPNYYFANPNDKTKADLDVLMMTQGYRRFSWKKVMDNAAAPLLEFQPERSLSITGHIKTTGGKPLPKGKVTLFTTAGTSLLLDTVADATGKFVFDNLTFPDSIKFVVQARTKTNGKNVEITLDNIPSRFVKKNINTAGVEITASDIPMAYLQNSNKKFSEDVKYDPGSHSILLKQVTINKQRKGVIEHSENLNGPGMADATLVPGEEGWTNGCPAIQPCLQGRLSGVRFNGGVPFLTSPHIKLDGTGAQPMLVVIDGIQLEPDEVEPQLSALTFSQIQSIEILRTAAYTVLYGAMGASGVFIITTKRGGPATYVRYAPGLIAYHPIGYAKQREFYSPQYDDPKTNRMAADLRSTIFWKPNVITDKNGSASFHFFNADGKGTYKVIVEGIDNDGNLGRQVFRYKVE